MHPAIVSAISAAVGATFAFLAVKLLDRLRRRDAETEAHSIVDRAKLDSSNMVKEAQLRIKEESIQQKAEMDREMNKLRDQLRDRERSLDKRQEAIEQQG
jgi:ribonuclease Y